MRRPLVLLVAIAAAAAHGIPHLKSTDPCRGALSEKACRSMSPNFECAWCAGANITVANMSDAALCYSRALNPMATCCTTAPRNPPTFQCSTIATLCHQGDVCATQTAPTTYGPCTAAQCCPEAKPSLCGGSCYDGRLDKCCGAGYGAMVCPVDKMCCGNAGGFNCCDKDGACCEAPDGDASWCCPKGQYCTITPYFGCANTSTPRL